MLSMGQAAGLVDTSKNAAAEKKMDTLTKRDIEAHLPVVGWLQIANSLVGIIAGIVLVSLLLGLGTVLDDPVLLRMMVVTASVLGGLLFILAVPGLVVGIGLLSRSPWSRIWALVVAVFELTLFPTGTLLGGYTIFVLSQRAAPEVFGACCDLEESRLQAASA